MAPDGARRGRLARGKKGVDTADPMRALAIPLSLLLAACSSAPSDDGSKSKLAADLVACKNEQLTLKEQLAQAKADLAKALAAANPTIQLDPMELKARQ